MEGLIPIIIVALMSFLFKGKKESDNTADKPVKSTPVRKPVSENPFKDLGDFAKQFTGERKQEMKPKPPVVKEAPVIVEKNGRELKRDQGLARSTGRLSTHQQKAPIIQVSTQEVSSLIPSTQDELIKGIIFSEILGPPKSKR